MLCNFWFMRTTRTVKGIRTTKHTLLLWYEIISNSFLMQINQKSFIKIVFRKLWNKFHIILLWMLYYFWVFESSDAVGIKGFPRYCRLVCMAKLWIVHRHLHGWLVQWNLVYSTRFLQHFSSNSFPNGIQA